MSPMASAPHRRSICVLCGPICGSVCGFLAPRRHEFGTSGIVQVEPGGPVGGEGGHLPANWAATTRPCGSRVAKSCRPSGLVWTRQARFGEEGPGPPRCETGASLSMKRLPPTFIRVV